jgi:hypothetical protein
MTKILDVHIDKVGNAGNETVAGTKTFSNEAVFSAGLNFGGDTLDDYEEGTFTPVLGGSGGQSGQSYNTQVGHYTKVGNQVTCLINVELTTRGTITGSLVIKDLPFTSVNTSGVVAGVSWGYVDEVDLDAGHILYGYMGINRTYISLGQIEYQNDNPGNLATGNVTNNTALTLSITYFTAS